MEFDDKENRYYACHHPFTAPRPEFFDDFVAGQNLDAIEASAYDMVLNGVEVGGGSLRIYRPDVQAAMFKLLGLSLDEAREKFDASTRALLEVLVTFNFGSTTWTSLEAASVPVP